MRLSDLSGVTCYMQAYGCVHLSSASAVCDVKFFQKYVTKSKQIRELKVKELFHQLEPKSCSANMALKRSMHLLLMNVRPSKWKSNSKQRWKEK